MPAEGEYRLTFPKLGAYAYLCMVHPLNMRGLVIVDEAGVEVLAPGAVEEEGQHELEGYVAEAQEAMDTSRDERVAANETSDGNAWQIGVGLDTPHAQVLAFMPGALEISTGQKVVFWNSERDFHNVVFVPDGMEPPPFPILKPAPEGRSGFRLLIDPDSVKELPPPAGFGPDDFFSSGMLGITFPRLYYEVTFPNPGTYRYFCTVHALAGMAGTITVN